MGNVRNMDLIIKKKEGSGWKTRLRSVNQAVSNRIDQGAGYAAMALCSGHDRRGAVGRGFLRYVLNDPLVWSEELSTFAMVWVAMIGGSMGIKGANHVGVTYVVDNVSWLKRHPGTVTVLVNLIILVFLLILPQRSPYPGPLCKGSAVPRPGNLHVLALFRHCFRRQPHGDPGGLPDSGRLYFPNTWA